MKPKALLLICCLCIIMTNCKKEPGVYYIDQEFKEWALFKEGSYWIYINEKNATSDSTYIQVPPVEMFLPTDPGEIHHEAIFIEYTSTFISKSEIQALQPANPTGNLTTSMVGIRDNYSYNYCLSDAMVKTTLQDQIFNCKVIERYDTIILNANRFHNVIQTQDSETVNGDYCIKNYFFAKNIGLLKYSIRTSTFDSTWSLLRWNVIQ